MKKINLILLIIVAISGFSFSKTANAYLEPIDVGIAAFSTAVVSGLATHSYLQTIGWNEPLISSCGMGYVVGAITGSIAAFCLIKQNLQHWKRKKTDFSDFKNKVEELAVLKINKHADQSQAIAFA